MKMMFSSCRRPPVWLSVTIKIFHHSAGVTALTAELEENIHTLFFRRRKEA